MNFQIRPLMKFTAHAHVIISKWSLLFNQIWNVQVNTSNSHWNYKWREKDGRYPRIPYKCDTYAGEEQSPQWRVDDVQDPVAEEDAENGEEQQHDEAHEQHASTGSEVVLALWWRRGKKQDVGKYELW